MIGLTLKRGLAVWILCALCVVCAAACAQEAQPWTVETDHGPAIAATRFEMDGVQAWWLQLPTEASLDGLRVSRMISGNSKSMTLSAPDAGASPESAGYIEWPAEGTENVSPVRLYFSRQPYAEAGGVRLRTLRAVGQWARAASGIQLLSSPGKNAERVGTLAANTRVYVLYSGRMNGVSYSCIRAAGETWFVRSSSLKLMNARTNLAFDTTLLTERRGTEELCFARTDYVTRMRSALGSAEGAVIDTVPVDTLLLVLARVNYDHTAYDLAARMDTGSVGFVHHSQLTQLSDAAAATMLARNSREQSNTPAAAAAREDTEARTYPSAASPRAFTVAAGQALYVYAELDSPEGGYCFVSAGERLGYVPRTAVEYTGEQQQTPSVLQFSADVRDALYSRYFRTVVREAVLYAEPGYGAAIARLSAGTRVDALEDRDGWKLVTAAGETGWLPAAFVEPERVGDTEEE